MSEVEHFGYIEKIQVSDPFEFDAPCAATEGWIDVKALVCLSKIMTRKEYVNMSVVWGLAPRSSLEISFS